MALIVSVIIGLIQDSGGLHIPRLPQDHELGVTVAANHDGRLRLSVRKREPTDELEAPRFG